VSQEAVHAAADLVTSCMKNAAQAAQISVPITEKVKIGQSWGNMVALAG